MGRVVALSATAVALAPISVLAGLVFLNWQSGLERVQRFLHGGARRSVGVEDADAPMDVDILMFSSERAWWLSSVDDSARARLALMLDVGSDEFVLLGTGWPEQWTNRRALFGSWVVYRSRPEGRILGVRAWGQRRPVRHEIVAPGAVDVDGRAIVRTRASLPLGLSHLVSAPNPYR